MDQTLLQYLQKAVEINRKTFEIASKEDIGTSNLNKTIVGYFSLVHEYHQGLLTLIESKCMAHLQHWQDH